MFTETPELYDTIYASFKDYRTEAEQLASLLARVAPAARTVLDVGCGTGEHARHLAEEHGYEVSGLDAEPTFVEFARAKLPKSRFWVADMSSFDLGVRFDAVLCLFSAIGYLRELTKVQEALARFRDHLAPGGVAVVEPWFTPELWSPGRIFVNSVEAEGLRVIRMGYAEATGRTSTLDFHYLVGRPTGVEHRTERHTLGLFTTDEMLGCFDRAGFATVDYDPVGLTGQGLYVAHPTSGG